MSKALGYTATAVSSSAVALDITPLTTNSTRHLLSRVEIRVETNAVRYRDDGTSPTASVGMPMSASDALVYADPAAVVAGTLKFIRQSADATVHASFYCE